MAKLLVILQRTRPDYNTIIISVNFADALFEHHIRIIADDIMDTHSSYENGNMFRKPDALVRRSGHR